MCPANPNHPPMTVADIHKHFGELLLILPVAVIIVALVKGKTPLPRIVAVLLDIQVVLGLVSAVLVYKGFNIAHAVCMIAACGVAHAFAKKEPQKVAIGFAAVLALLVTGYLCAKGKLPLDFRVSF